MSLCLAQAYFGNAIGENLFLTWLLITIGATVFTLLMVWFMIWNNLFFITIGVLLFAIALCAADVRVWRVSSGCVVRTCEEGCL
jgi:hypothetical protein